MAEAPSSSKPTITPRANGPLQVRGLAQLRDSKGAPLTVRPTLALCRCGGSANKPFCDGTHARNGFSSNSTADRSQDKQEPYPGPQVTILDNRFLCAHIGECTAGLAEVFRYGEAPWIDPAGADAARIQEAIGRCPSGALAYVLPGRAVPAPEREPAITVSKDGPYFVVGGCALETDAWSQGASRERYALCRCGKSRNKPFCDGSHWEAGFKDDRN